MKLKTIDYTTLLGIAVASIVDEHGHEFVHLESGGYAWAESSSKNKRMKLIESKMRALLDEMSIQCKKDDDVLVVLSSCFPKDNILASLEDSMPSKLRSFIESNPSTKWMLREKDISIDTSLLNEAADDVFIKLLKEQAKARDQMKSGHLSLVLVSHRCLDAYALKKIVEWAYGKSSCKDALDESTCRGADAVVSLNDVLERCAVGKEKLNRSKQMKDAALEVREYLDRMLRVDRK